MDLLAVAHIVILLKNSGKLSVRVYMEVGGYKQVRFIKLQHLLRTPLVDCRQRMLCLVSPFPG